MTSYDVNNFLTAQMIKEIKIHNKCINTFLKDSIKSNQTQLKKIFFFKK